MNEPMIGPGSTPRVPDSARTIDITPTYYVQHPDGTYSEADPQPNLPHQDDIAVDQFAVMLKGKLAKARMKGRSGWRDHSWSSKDINAQMHAHAAKGDPLDVAAYAMFLALRGEPTEAPPIAPAITRESLRAELRKLIDDGRCLFDPQHIVHFKEHDIVDVLRKLGIEVKE